MSVEERDQFSGPKAATTVACYQCFLFAINVTVHRISPHRDRRRSVAAPSFCGLDGVYCRGVGRAHTGFGSAIASAAPIAAGSPAVDAPAWRTSVASAMQAV